MSLAGLSSVWSPPDFQAHTGAHRRTVCAAPIARRCCHRCPGLQRHHRLQQGRGHLSVKAVAAHRQGDVSSDEDEGYNQVELLEDEHELEEVLHEAGKKLVVLEVQGVAVCETGLLEPELNWKLDQEAQHAKRMQACKDLQRNYYRIARDIPDVHFCEIMVDDNTPEGEALKARLGVTVLPTIQFFRDNKLLWQQEGYLNMEEEFNAGLLYYRDLIAGRTTGMVQELNSQQDLTNFINTPDKDMLQVVAVTTELCSPCIKVYPAVIALARHLVGHASFARLLGDRDKGTTQLMAELGILEVPCFIFYRNGKLLGRHVGSSRSDLIGQILIHQQAAGLPMPPPPKPAQAMAPARAKATAGASRPKRNLWK